MTNERTYEDLVLSILAVNAHPLTKVYPIRDGLRYQGLLAPELVSQWDHDTTCRHLKAAGYDRGPYYESILASRLQELALFAQDGGLNQIKELMKVGDRDRLDQLLLSVHGIGPAVLRNFWTLQGDHDLHR